MAAIKRMKFHKNLTFWIALAAIAGYTSAQIIGDSDWTSTSNPPLFYALILLVKTAFLALLKMLVAPIIFFSLIGGLLHIGDASRLKTLGATAIIYYLATTAIAITIGLVVVFYIHPWEGVVEPISIETATQSGSYIAPKQLIDHNSDSLVQVLGNMLSLALTNPFSALADMNILGIATNAFLIGLAMLTTLPKDSVLATGIHHINKVLQKVLAWAMITMPFGIFAIIFDVVLKSSGSFIESLLSFCAVVFGATLVHGLIVLPAIALIVAKVNPIDFISQGKQTATGGLSYLLQRRHTAGEYANCREGVWCFRYRSRFYFSAWRHDEYGWHRLI